MDWTNLRLRRVASLGTLFLSASLLATLFHNRDEAEAAPERGNPVPAKMKADPPVRGWFSVLKRMYYRFSEDRVTTVAGGVTFFSLLAIFPAIAALVSIYGLFSDPTRLTGHIESLRHVMPEGGVEVVGDQMRHVASQGRSALGTTFFISLAISLWSANSGMKALFDALNIVYDVNERRSFFRLNAISLMYTFGAIGFILLALAALVVLPVVFSYVGLGSAIAQILNVGRWPALLIVLMFTLALVYRFGPNRERAKWRWITWGSAIAALLWLGASALFSWYAESFGNFNRTYGTLGAVIGFMMWLWISAIVILVGAELDAELECQDPSPGEFSDGEPSPENVRP
jgi:membrane protein